MTATAPSNSHRRHPAPRRRPGPQVRRTRHGDSDFDRRPPAANHRAALDRAHSPSTLPRLPRLAAAVSDAVDTNAGRCGGSAGRMGRAPGAGLGPPWWIAPWPATTSPVGPKCCCQLGGHSGAGEPDVCRPAARRPALAGREPAVENATEPGLATQTAAFLGTQGATITWPTARAGPSIGRSSTYPPPPRAR